MGSAQWVLATLEGWTDFVYLRAFGGQLPGKNLAPIYQTSSWREAKSLFPNGVPPYEKVVPTPDPMGYSPLPEVGSKEIFKLKTPGTARLPEIGTKGNRTGT
ncbi:MAG: hypothetical protein CM1200mP18_08040 [Gammaproteobacteria bacterium]|nr:MAG: hypothetical protein CM1200mP18_08040 [Gammaproteobacteria bacterium]